jgi:hypothetical protein
MLPTVFPSRFPTFPPSFRPSRSPSFSSTLCPSSGSILHGSPPTLSPIAYTPVVVSGDKVYYADRQQQKDENIQYLINCTTKVIIYSNPDASNKFTMIPSSVSSSDSDASFNDTITIIHNFNIAFDIIDLAAFPFLRGIEDLSYISPPLTLVLTATQKIVLFPQKNDEVDISSIRFLFLTPSAVSSTASSDTSHSTIFSSGLSLNEMLCIIVVLVIILLTVIIMNQRWWITRVHGKTKRKKRFSSSSSTSPLPVPFSSSSLPQGEYNGEIQQVNQFTEKEEEMAGLSDAVDYSMNSDLFFDLHDDEDDAIVSSLHEPLGNNNMHELRDDGPSSEYHLSSSNDEEEELDNNDSIEFSDDEML